MNAKEKKYLIEMNSKQMQVMQDALEFYSRFLHGQVDSIPSCLDYKLKMENRISNNASLEYAVILFKKEMFGIDSRNSHYGIGTRSFNTLQDGKELIEPQIAYEMYKMILYKWNKEWQEENPNESNHSVHSSPPLSYSGLEFINIKDKKDVE
jgi:hypothetical protein